MGESHGTHRELLLPDPLDRPLDLPPVPPPLIIERSHTSWTEVHRNAEGTIRFYLGAKGPAEVNHTYYGLAGACPGLELGPPAKCPLRSLRLENTQFLLAFLPCEPDYGPRPLSDQEDPAGLLLESLAEKGLDGHEVVLQTVFRRVRYSEKGSVVGRHDDFHESKGLGPDGNPAPMSVRPRDEPAYRAEIRAALQGPDPVLASFPILRWLGSFTSVDGAAGWDLLNPIGKDRSRFLRSLRDHSPVSSYFGSP